MAPVGIGFRVRHKQPLLPRKQIYLPSEQERLYQCLPSHLPHSYHGARQYGYADYNEFIKDAQASFVPHCECLFWTCCAKICVPGQFEVVSPTVSNYRAGMRANYTVEKCGLFQRQSEIMLHSKTYYIAAMEIEWDYSPSRTWETANFPGQERYRSSWVSICMRGTFSVTQALLQHQQSMYPSEVLLNNISLSDCSPGSVFLDKQAGFIGSRYKKVVYRQFTSDKFTKQVERTADMEHLGIMGMVSAGDTPQFVSVDLTFVSQSALFCDLVIKFAMSLIQV